MPSVCFVLRTGPHASASVFVSLFGVPAFGRMHFETGIDALGARAHRPKSPARSVRRDIRLRQGGDADAQHRRGPTPAGPEAEAPVLSQARWCACKARRLAMLAPSKPQVATVLVATSGEQVYRRRFRDAKPINFGKASPKQLAVHGVDVSRWQGEIDWEKLRSQGANFAYIKATDGGDHLDPMFRKNWRARRSGRPAARRLPFLLLVPHRRRAGRLVHPQRPESRRRAAAGDRRRMERQVVLQAAAVARESAGEDAGLHGQAGGALRPAPDHLHSAGLLSRQSEGRVSGLSVLAALGGGASLETLSGPQMGVLAIFGVRPVAWRDAAGSTSTCSTAARPNGGSGWPPTDQAV